ncbi:MAG TPA: AraC family transcriptional regulator [Polyangiales bacterium]|nr:AraC family transcriptional regulator [Polyangiales bacterium]
MVSARAVNTLIDSVAAAGVPRARFLRVARLEPAQLHADARLPRRKLFELFELALQQTGDAAFALHSMERLAPDALNPLAALVVHAATLREALSGIQEFRRLLGDDPSFRVYEQGTHVVVRCEDLADESTSVRRFFAEVTLAGLFRLLRRFRADARIGCVMFAYGAPAYQHEYARVFHGLARFDQPFTGLRFDREILRSSAPYADRELHDTLRLFAKRRMTRLTEDVPYSTRVREVLVWQPPPRELGMASVARKLGVSVRSLRRYLTAEGKPYPELVNEALASIAKKCLRDEGRSIVDTAAELGFADHTSFHRAFKRWTGLTPSEYRRQHAPQR